MLKKRVLIVGGGFGGVKSAITLSRDPRLDITLLSERKNFRFYPTLYRTATGGISSESSIPLKSIFEDRPVDLRIGKAIHLNKEAKTITTADGDKFHYDFLVLSLGVVTNYFGIKGLEEYSFGIKSLEEANRLKRHLHKQLIDERRPDLNYVIVGGGPTGIELAGALAQYIHKIMRCHDIRNRPIHIDLVEAAPRLMSRMPVAMSHKIADRLRSLGVKLELGKTVEGEGADSLVISGKTITSHTVVWTAGVTNNPFFSENGFDITNHGKVAVDQYLQSAPDVFVIGDNANTPFSGTAQTALYDAHFISKNLIRHVEGKYPLPYIPKSPIYVTPAGPYWAAVLWGKIQFYGLIGWAMHQAAEFRGFHDLLKLLPASEQWVKEFEQEDNCPVCAASPNN